MAEMPLTERGVPQDGRIHVRHEERDYDLRISSLPSLHGESIVIRIFDASVMGVGLDDIGLHPDLRASFSELLARPSGLVVVAGPTGSGKTTTLYAALKSLVRPELALFSIEDPVEYRIEGVTQVDLNRKTGLDFAAAMRYIMRQDPDVILCGEIRNRETLELCVQAALTGHLVLTTLHTNDAVQVIRRMAEIGLDRFLIADSLIGVLAQRLVRKTHLECGTLHELTDAQRQWLKHAGVAELPDTLTRGMGCAGCRNTGYRGRTTIAELLVVDDGLRRMIAGDADLQDIERLAASKRVPMLEDAAGKVLAGEVAIGEAMRVTGFLPEYQ
jgi:type II secretory ATPase GspE/PulE/Tfp pilus assembly ATPase PilB-like protein